MTPIKWALESFDWYPLEMGIIVGNSSSSRLACRLRRFQKISSNSSARRAINPPTILPAIAPIREEESGFSEFDSGDEEGSTFEGEENGGEGVEDVDGVDEWDEVGGFEEESDEDDGTEKDDEGDCCGGRIGASSALV